MTASRTRRAFLLGAIGAAAAAVGQPLGRVATVRATDGEPVELGADQTTAATTTIRNQTTDAPVFIVRSDGAGSTIVGVASGGNGVQGSTVDTNAAGVHGFSASGTGVSGLGEQFVGVEGRSVSGTGVQAVSASTGKAALFARNSNGAPGVVAVSGMSANTADPPMPLDTGVFGFAPGYDGRPVSAPVGVHGRATGGTGVFAEADANGTALRVQGRAVFSRSGIVSIASGRSSVKKTVPGLLSGATVYAVVRSGPATVWVRKVVVANGAFTVLLNRTASASTTVSWIAFG